MRAQFVLSEIGVGLRRNLTMTIAVVVSVALSLSLAGAGWLVRDQASAMKDYWYNKVEVTIYLCNASDKKTTPSCSSGAVSPQQQKSILSDLKKLNVVEKVYHETAAQAYANYKKQFKGSPLLVGVTPASMQQDYRIKLTDPTKYNIIASEFSSRPGVQSVNDERQVLQPLFKLMSKLQLIAWVVMAFMLFVAVLLIVNTVRVSAFSRRRETSIMRLVGASGYYIQMPFIMEAAVAGVVGSLLACGLLAAVQEFVIEKQLRSAILSINFIGWDSVISTMPLIVVFGVLMSGLAAFFTLRRYLQV